MRPIFLLSPPRSGSTLVQRVLAAHPDIATASEPWLLLPFVYARRDKGTIAEYWHVAAAEAIEDFVRGLPGGEGEFDRRLHDFAVDLYDAASGGAPYFLDKNPQYHFIAEDVIRLFPEAKLVYLWRNPLAVVASLLETFHEGRFEPYNFRPLIYEAIDNLVRAYRASRERACAVRYEDLVGDGAQAEWRRLFDYLELDFDPEVLERFREVRLKGRYGDPTGIHRYQSITPEPVEKWKATLVGPVRKAWAHRYLKRLGERSLTEMGYDLDGLHGELAAMPPGRWSVVPFDLPPLALSYARDRRLQHALTLKETPLPRGEIFGVRAGRGRTLERRLRNALLMGSR